MLQGVTRNRSILKGEKALGKLSIGGKSFSEVWIAERHVSCTERVNA